MDFEKDMSDLQPDEQISKLERMINNTSTQPLTTELRAPNKINPQPLTTEPSDAKIFKTVIYSYINNTSPQPLNTELRAPNKTSPQPPTTETPAPGKIQNSHPF